MKVIQVIFFCVCILFVIMSCAHQPAGIQFCENQKCAVLTEADSKEAFLKLTHMIEANLNKKIPLLVSTWKGGEPDKDIVIEWKAGAIKQDFRLVRINSLAFTDITSVDRENREIKVMAQFDYSHSDPWVAGTLIYEAGSYTTVPMPFSLTVKSSKEIIFQGKTKLYVYNLFFDGLIDHIDTDRLFWGCAFTTRLSFSALGATNHGYLHLAF
ncbi:MAG: hypothetical protein ACXWMC_04830 [Syntrophales bacterium]